MNNTKSEAISFNNTVLTLAVFGWIVQLLISTIYIYIFYHRESTEIKSFKKQKATKRRGKTYMSYLSVSDLLETQKSSPFISDNISSFFLPVFTPLLCKQSLLTHSVPCPVISLITPVSHHP